MLMGMTDRFDLPVSSASAEALDDYVAAVDLLLSANTGAAELLERALTAEPDFALAHIARARLLQLQARIPQAREAVTRAKTFRASVTAREQRHIDAIALAVEGAATEALARSHSCRGVPARRAAPVVGARGLWAPRLQRAARSP